LHDADDAVDAMMMKWRSLTMMTPMMLSFGAMVVMVWEMMVA
jgi:hypothetical protein